MLGRGGKGVVWVAWDLALRREVALKIAQGPPRLVERLRAEAELTARLEHPGIVPVHDVGALDAPLATDAAASRLFYVMRLVRGRSLAQALADLRALPAPAQRVARHALVGHVLDAARAVGFAHRHGVLHRDLKPGNLLLGELDDTQVADWGLAVAIDAATADGEAAHVVGSPPWMAPEVARGAPASTRSDVFGLGAVLVEVLTGRPPFAAADRDTALAAARAGSRAPLDAGVAPAALLAIADKATAIDPAARYADAAELAADLGRYQSGERVQAHDYGPIELARRFWAAFRVPITVALVAGGLLLLTMAVAWRRTAAERDRASAAERVASAARVVAEQRNAELLADRAQDALLRGVRAEAAALAVAALGHAESSEARGVLAAVLAQPMPTHLGRAPLSARCPQPTLAPGGDGLVCLDGVAALWWLPGKDGAAGPALDQPPRRLEGAWHDAALLPDVDRLVLARGHQDVVVLRASDGVAIAAPRLVDNPTPLLPARRGGRVLAPGAAQATLLSAVDGAVVATLSCQDDGGAAAGALAAGGDAMAVACKAGAVMVWREGTGPRRLAVALAPAHGGLSAAAMSDDGRTFVAVGVDGAVVALDLDSGIQRDLVTLQLGYVHTVRFAASADGGRLFVAGAVGGVAVLRLTDGAELDRLPATRQRAIAAPDGDHLVSAGEGLERWRLPSRPVPQVLAWPGHGAAALTLGPGRAFVGRGDGVVEQVDTTTMTLRWRRALCDSTAKSLALGADGALTVLCSLVPGLWRLDAATGTPRAGPLAQGGRRIALLGTGGGAAPAAGASVVALLDARRRLLVAQVPTTEAVDIRAPLPTLSVEEGEFFDLEASDDGVAIVGPGGDVVWLPAALTPGGAPWPTTPLWPEARAQYVSHDATSGRTAVAADATLAVVERGGAPRTLGASGAAAAGVRVLDVALAPGGALLAAARIDGTIELWRLADGAAAGDLRVALLRGHEGRVANVAFEADGATLWSVGWDGSLRRWAVAAALAPAPAPSPWPWPGVDSPRAASEIRRDDVP